MNIPFNLSPKSLMQFFLKASYLGIVGFFLLDFNFYFGFVQNNLVSPFLLTLVVLLIHVFIRAVKHQKLSDDFSKVNLFVLAPLSLLMPLIAYYLEEYGLLFPNYFFVNFDFHYLALPFMAVPFIGFGALHASKKFWKDNWRSLVFLGSLFVVAGAGFLSYFDRELYDALVKEDGVVEYLSALGFAVSGILSLFLIKKTQLFFKSCC
jgi:hypothetical protein